MQDNESIIKSFVGYLKSNHFPSGRYLMLKNTLDLINRQQAEIERLKAEIEETNEADREAEVQALSESKENAKLFCEAINHAKTEAIKEFAERLKECRVIQTANMSGYIDNLVKEMTEQSVNYESSKITEQ